MSSPTATAPGRRRSSLPAPSGTDGAGEGGPAVREGRLGDQKLSVEGLVMAFDHKQVLTGVHLTFEPGAVHGLVGHNGSGKSTLVRILAGYYQPVAGTVTLGARPVPLGSPRAARALGLRFVHQDLALVAQFSALENFGLGGEYPRTARRTIDWAEQGRRMASAFERLGSQPPPVGPVSRLSAVQRTLVAIARAISEGSAGDGIRFLILDEPTTTLEPSEREHLFGVIRRLADSGIGVILISHQLSEVIDLCTAVSVLRDGQVVGTFATADVTQEGLVSAMLGPELAGAPEVRHAGRASGPPDAAALAVRGLRSATLRMVDLAVARGECVAVIGLAGSGREELAYAVAGAVPAAATETRVNGAAVGALTPVRCRRQRVALVPGNRLPGSMVSSFTLRENLTLASLTEVSGRFGRINRRKEAAVAREWVERFDIRPGDPEYGSRFLSGGNKQKMILAKWLRTDPVVMLIDEPTAGVDVGAVKTLLTTLREYADRGGAVLMSTSELGDAIAIADRILVLREGVVASELVRGRDDLSEKNLLLAMAGHTAPPLPALPDPKGAPRDVR